MEFAIAKPVWCILLFVHVVIKPGGGYLIFHYAMCVCCVYVLYVFVCIQTVYQDERMSNKVDWSYTMAMKLLEA